MIRFYRVSASVRKHTEHGFIPCTVPTFYLDQDALEITGEDHAKRIAEKILDAKGETDHPTYIKVEEGGS